MRPTVHSVLVAIVVATPAWAQSVPASPPSVATPSSQVSPRLDASGGLTLARIEPGPDLDRQGLAGWHASIAVYPFSRLGVAAELAGARRTPSLEDTRVPDAQVRLNQRTFLVGPSVRIIRRNRLSTSFRALFGVARVTAESHRMSFRTASCLARHQRISVCSRTTLYLPLPSDRIGTSRSRRRWPCD